jgi:hypothetical protein
MPEAAAGRSCTERGSTQGTLPVPCSVAQPCCAAQLLLSAVLSKAVVPEVAAGCLC